MFDVFISYSSKDQEDVDELYEFLYKKGIHCWLATSENGIKPGELYPQSIVDGIKNSKLVLLVETINSVQSIYVHRELNYAVKEKKNILRVLLKDYDRIKVEENLKIIDFYTDIVQHFKMNEENFSYSLSSLYSIIYGMIYGKKSLEEMKNSIIGKIERYFKMYSLVDPKWSKAISSQYFLFEISHLLNIDGREDCAELIEEFLKYSLKISKSLKVLPAPNQILIVPDENEKLIQRMREEEKILEYPERLLTKYIDTSAKKDRIYYNYYYGLMIGILNRLCTICEENDEYKKMRSKVLDELLFQNQSLDEVGGGLYHYRLPWLTARAAISISFLKNNDIRAVMHAISILHDDESIDSEKFNIIKKNLIQSIVDRMELSGYWKSGAGNWVDKWESTGLCLEAIYVNDYIENYKREIKTIFDFLSQKENYRDWFKVEGFESEEKSNKTLSNIVLVSTFFRILNKKPNLIGSFGIANKMKFLELFEECINNIIKASTNKSIEDAIRQKCTIPQCIYYILVAIKEME